MKKVFFALISLMLICMTGCSKVNEIIPSINIKNDGFTERAILALYKIATGNELGLDSEIDRKDRVQLKQLAHDLNCYVEISQKTLGISKKEAIEILLMYGGYDSKLDGKLQVQ